MTQTDGVMRPVLLSLSIVLGLCGCQSDEEPDRPGAIGIGGSGAPKGSGSGDGGMGGQVADGSVSGDVVQFVNDSFSATTVFSTPSEVHVANANGTRINSGDYDGVEFVVEGDVEGTRWVLVQPDGDPAGYPTLTQQDLTDSPVSLPITQRAVLDNMFQSFSTPTELIESRAQLLIVVVDGSGAGVAQVEASIFGSGAPLVAYKEGGTWQDLTDRTSTDGLIFVPNLEASEFPGQSAQVVLTGAVEGEPEVRLVSGAITVVTVVVP